MAIRDTLRRMDRRALVSTPARSVSTARPSVAAIAVLAALALAGCATSVEPPPEPRDPVVVVLVDWGWHSSLLLPRRESGCTEYAFGEWEWFARGNDGWWRAPAVLFWPRDGTLGRRDWPSPDSAVVSAEAAHTLHVERAASEALRARLERSFEGRDPLRLPGRKGGLEFVPFDESFWLGHTCNGATAEWLRELGCRVGGPVVTARFEVEPSAAR